MRWSWMGVAGVALAAGLVAQEGGEQKALKEFRELALKKVQGFEEMRARGDALGEWLEQHGKTDFGEWNFAKPVARYFARDYKTAGEELSSYLAKHGKLPAKAFDTICGRVLLNHAVVSFREGAIGKGRKSLHGALDLYDNPTTIYAAAGRILRGIDDDDARSVLVELAGKLAADTRLDDRKKLDLLQRVYGGPPAAPARAAGPGGPARPGPAGPPGNRRPARPTTIQPFTATDMDGKELSLADYKGQVVLVDFWATWCGPCLREMPNVVEVYEKYNAAGFEIVGVSLDKPNAAEKIRETMKKLGMTWRQVYDGGGWGARLAKQNNIRSIPATFLFDRNGKCRASSLRGDALEREVRKLLKETTGDKR